MDKTNNTRPESLVHRSVSRRTALKAAAAAGAAAYATPLISTLVAHAAGGVSTFGNLNVFVTTCGADATFSNGAVNISPNSPTCTGNNVTIKPNGGPSESGLAVASVEVGTTNVETVIVNMGTDVCTITVTGVVANCAIPAGTQTIDISCLSGFTTGGPTPITSGKVALTTCP